jgi:plasmid segregation protein ParM
MCVAYEQIRRVVNAKFGGIEVKEFEIPEVVRTGKIRGVDVSEIVNDAFYSLATNIVLEVKNKWGNAWEIEQIVFTGGGAELLKPYLSQAFDAIFCGQKDNVTGLLWYARRMWGDAK